MDTLLVPLPHAHPRGSSSSASLGRMDTALMEVLLEQGEKPLLALSMTQKLPFLPPSLPATLRGSPRRAGAGRHQLPGSLSQPHLPCPSLLPFYDHK